MWIQGEMNINKMMMGKNIDSLHFFVNNTDIFKTIRTEFPQMWPSNSISRYLAESLKHYSERHLHYYVGI